MSEIFECRPTSDIERNKFTGQGLTFSGRKRDFARLERVPNFAGQPKGVAERLQNHFGASQTAGNENATNAFFALSFKKSNRAAHFVSEAPQRTAANLRHAAVGESGEPTFTVAGLRVDQVKRLVQIDGKDVHLTPIEYRLLTTLVRHAGRVLSQRQLLKEVWGPAHTDQAHYLRVYMGTLRRKLEQDPARPRYLLTEPGVGYRLAAE